MAALLNIRKTMILKETLYAEAGRTANRPVVRAAALAVIENPFAGRFVEDLSPLFDLGLELGEKLMGEVAGLLSGPATSYGKAAIVGVAGDFEHGGALVHPKLGKPMRAAVGGGEAVIGSAVKVAAPGTMIDVPLGHKDNSWSFDHFDTWTMAIPDAPRPHEVVVIMAVADGGRLNARCGKGRAVL